MRWYIQHSSLQTNNVWHYIISSEPPSPLFDALGVSSIHPFFTPYSENALGSFVVERKRLTTAFFILPRAQTLWILSLLSANTRQHSFLLPWMRTLWDLRCQVQTIDDHSFYPPWARTLWNTLLSSANARRHTFLLPYFVDEHPSFTVSLLCFLSSLPISLGLVSPPTASAIIVIIICMVFLLAALHLLLLTFSRLHLACFS